MTVPHMKDVRGSLAEVEGGARHMPALPVHTMGPGGAKVVGNIVTGSPVEGASSVAAKVGPGDMIADRTTETGKAEDRGDANKHSSLYGKAYGDLVSGGAKGESNSKSASPSNDRGVAGPA